MSLKRKRPPDRLSNLEGELVSIRNSLSELSELYRGNLLNARPQRAPRKLEVFFTRSESERKPFLARFDGIISSEIRLSPIRAAIPIVLLLDLEDRLDRGKGILDITSAISDALRVLDRTSGRDKTESGEKIRVALYRFWDFCEKGRFLRGSRYHLIFSDTLQRMLCLDSKGREVKTEIVVDLTTDQAGINTVLERNITRSPSSQVRRRRALYIPSGMHGSDQFLLEMYDHKFSLRVTSLYVRPPLTTYPVELLKRIGVSEKVVRRKELAFEGYRSGRFEFFEILQEEVVWDLIRLLPDSKKFKHYPASFKVRDVAAHLSNLIEILEDYENYHFYVTRAHIPFALVTYEIRSGIFPEYFTVFFDSFGAAASRDLGCFALCDPGVYQNISEHIVNWILQHPTTERSREAVVALLNRVLKRLERKGPLGADQQTE